MDFEPLNRIETDTSLYQPAILPHAIALTEQNMFLCANDPGVRFLAMDLKDHDYQGETDQFNAYVQDTWAIGSILMRNTLHYPKQMTPLSVGTNGAPHFDFMFANLYEEEKDRIMRALHDDVLYARLYKNPKDFHKIMNTRVELPEDLPLVPSSLLTTKTVLLPDHVRRGYRENKEDMFNYLQQDITPGLLRAEHFSEQHFETLCKWAHQYGNYMYPSQFIAMRDRYIEDVETGDLYTGPTEETYGYLPAEREVLFAGQYRQVDCWNVYYVSPYKMVPVQLYEDMEDAVEFLEQAEKHFIDPFYKKDLKLAFLEEQLSIVPDFRPTHYSQVTLGHAMVANYPSFGIPN